jgi:hypothetical protein
LDNNLLVWQIFPSVSLELVCPKFTPFKLNTQEGDYLKVNASKSAGTP